MIGENSEQLGVMPLRQAIQLARERGVDLVEVAPNTQPPVCRMLDYGKFKYEQTKKEKESRKHQKVISLRQVRLRPRTGEHDIISKITLVQKLLDEGNKVNVMMVFRGREITHPAVGKEIMDKIAKALAERAALERPLVMEANAMTMIFAPKPAKQPAKEVKDAAKEAKEKKETVDA